MQKLGYKMHVLCINFYIYIFLIIAIIIIYDSLVYFIYSFKL